MNNPAAGGFLTDKNESPKDYFENFTQVMTEVLTLTRVISH